MATRHHLSAWLLPVLFCLAGPGSAEQPPEADVAYVETPQRVVQAMLELAETQADELVLDLGSGDGRIPITAARDFGARGRGVEIEPTLVKRSRRLAEEAGVDDRVRINQGDLFEAELGQADIITLYLLPALNLRLKPRLLELAPGTRVVSHEFDMGAWSPDAEQEVHGRDIYLWIVPAQLSGSWRLYSEIAEIDLKLEQRFQALSGEARVEDEGQRLRDVRLKGREFQFNLQLDGEWMRFRGRVEEERIQLESAPALSDFQSPVEWRMESQ